MCVCGSRSIILLCRMSSGAALGCQRLCMEPRPPLASGPMCASQRFPHVERELEGRHLPGTPEGTLELLSSALMGSSTRDSK